MRFQKTESLSETFPILTDVEDVPKTQKYAAVYVFRSKRIICLSQIGQPRGGNWDFPF